MYMYLLTDGCCYSSVGSAVGLTAQFGNMGQSNTQSEECRPGRRQRMSGRSRVATGGLPCHSHVDGGLNCAVPGSS